MIPDETTASTTEDHVNDGQAIVAAERAAGMSLVFVSYRLPEVFALSDRIAVPRNGRPVQVVSVRHVSGAAATSPRRSSSPPSCLCPRRRRRSRSPTPVLYGAYTAAYHWPEVPYSASKAAVVGFRPALARELAAYGITVNCVAPGPIDTDVMGGRLPPSARPRCPPTSR